MERGLKRWEEIGEVGDLLVGKFAGRTRADQITVFAKNTPPRSAPVPSLSPKPKASATKCPRSGFWKIRPPDL